MGSRSQIVLPQRGQEIFLYAHWLGQEIKAVVRDALRDGRSRWEDEEYFARILFCRMVRGNELAQTGFGIGTFQHGDVEYDLLVVDCAAGKVTQRARKGGRAVRSWSFGEFAALDDAALELIRLN